MAIARRGEGGRVYAYPALPYNWAPRPPSVNRLPGIAWLAYAVRARAFDAEFDADIRGFFKDFYHLDLTDAAAAEAGWRAVARAARRCAATL